MWKCIRCEKENQDSEESCTACGHGKTMDYTGHRTLAKISSSVTDNWKSSQNTSEYFIKQGREYLQKIIECLEKTNVDSADDIENMTVAELKNYFKTGGTDSVKEKHVLRTDYDEKYVLGSHIERKNIQKIKFVKIKRSQLPESAWDVSSDENETIWAWTEDAGRILKIGAESRIYANSDCSGLFSDYTEVKAIEFNDMFDTARVTNMSHMFSTCKNLVRLDVAKFNTVLVTDMSSMFCECKNLTELDVTGFDTGSVTDMSRMFYQCKNLMKLDVTGFDTGRVTDMSWMFAGCKNLMKLDVTGFDTDRVTDMSGMFDSCKNLKELDVTGFDTGRVTNMSDMFGGCENLKELDVTRFDTSHVMDMAGMFCDCENFTELDVTGFDTGCVEDMSYMFCGCENLMNLDVTGFNTGCVTDMSSMFQRCENLMELNVTGFCTTFVTEMSRMFYGCKNLIELDGSENIKYKYNIADTEDMFEGCEKLEI